jgi:hypothetical protein
MPWNDLNSESKVPDREIAELRLRRIEIDDLDTAIPVEVKVRREAGYLSLLVRHAFRLATPGNPSIAG